MRLVTHQIDVAAPPEVLYEAFTDPDQLAAWLDATAEADPRPGGSLRWTHENGSTVAGTFVELVPHRRVVFTYGWEDGSFGVAPGSTRVEVDLEPTADGTRLTHVHHGLEGEAADRHQQGWGHFLARLQARVDGGDPTAVPPLR